MKYADGPTTEVEVHVDAPAERVWALASDINVPARFSAELQEARWLDGDGPVVGARFKGRNHHPAVGEWETTCIVTVADPGRSFGWAVEDADSPAASWRFDIEPDGDGVRLRQWAQIGPAPSGLTAAIQAMPDKEERIVARRLEEHRANMLRTVEGIKALAEGDGA
jgi:hypothetical protein